MLGLGLSIPERATLGTGGGSASAGPYPSNAAMIARYYAANPDNGWVAGLNRTFSSSDVSVANNSIVLSGLELPTLTDNKGGDGVAIRFANTGGALPTTIPQIVAGQDYWAEIDNVLGGNNLAVYLDGNNGPIPPGHIAGETIRPAQNRYARRNRVVFVDGGSGTHTITSEDGFSKWADTSADKFDCFPAVANSRHHRTTRAIVGGKPVMRSVGGIARRLETETFYSDYGKYLGMLGTTQGTKLQGRAKSQGARSAFYVAACRIETIRVFSTKKLFLAAADFNASTEIVTEAAHGGVTGNLVYLDGYSAGATAPGGITFGGDLFFRSVSANTFSLHTTLAGSQDASGTLDRVDITSQGSGTFMLYFPQRSGDYERSQFFIEWLDPVTGNNTLALAAQSCFSNFFFNAATAVTAVAGGTGNAGQVTGLTAYNRASFGGICPVTIWVCPRSIGPTCLDTGLPLTSGDYWLTFSGSSARFHRTLASAQNSLGQTTANSSNIKFTAAGEGEIRIIVNDGKVDLSFGAGSDRFDTRVPANQWLSLAMHIDRNPPVEANPVAKLFLNGVLVETKTFTFLTKGLLGSPATDTGSPPWSVRQSAQGHVAFKGEVRDEALYVSTDLIPDSDVIAAQQWHMAEYGIT